MICGGISEDLARPMVKDLADGLVFAQISPGGPSGSALLMESGSYILLESGDFLLLE